MIKTTISSIIPGNVIPSETIKTLKTLDKTIEIDLAVFNILTSFVNTYTIKEAYLQSHSDNYHAEIKSINNVFNKSIMPILNTLLREYRAVILDDSCTEADWELPIIKTYVMDLRRGL